MALTISSPAFENGGEIPRRYTCDGEDISPELRFGGIPQHEATMIAGGNAAKLYRHPLPTGSDWPTVS